MALSGVAFVPFFVIGWVTSVAKNPHYTAPDQEWTNWAHDNQGKGRISAFAMLLAALIFLYFIAAIRGAVLTMRSGVFSRWIGFVALIGAVCFLITFLTIIDNTGNGSVFGYAFFPGLLALITWTLATSIAGYRTETAAVPVIPVT